ncbi:MAG: lasso peptide biosynthesis B2 protein [Acidimicrobiales bacterium]
MHLALEPKRLLAAAESLVLLAAAEVSLRFAALPRAVHWFGATLDFGDPAGERDAHPLDLSPVERHKLIVLGRVARHWPLSPGGVCLRHSLAASHVMRARQPRLRIGVAPGPRAEIMAHAWLEVDGAAVTQPRDFLPLLRLGDTIGTRDKELFPKEGHHWEQL